MEELLFVASELKDTYFLMIAYGRFILLKVIIPEKISLMSFCLLMSTSMIKQHFLTYNEKKMRPKEGSEITNKAP